MIGLTVIDTGLNPERRGTVVSVDPERLDVIVEWRPGMVATLNVVDIRAGRYKVIITA